MIEQGAAINVEDSSGYTPLHAAASEGSIACLKILLRAGAEIDGKSKTNTPLHLAVQKGHPEAVQVLFVLLLWLIRLLLGHFGGISKMLGDHQREEQG